MGTTRFGLCLSLVALAGGCGSSQPHALISVGADGSLEQYDLYVRDDATRSIFRSNWSPVRNADGKSVDTAHAPFKIGVTFDHPGDYTVLIAGAIGPIDPGGKVPDLSKGARQFFWIQAFHADGDKEVSAHLIEVGPDDADRDIFPDKAKWPQDKPDAKQFEPRLLDCDDGKDTVNPFAAEHCGNKVDEDCDGNDTTCVDSDGDGDPDDHDCKPMDPKIHYPTTADPTPESANCCGYALGKTGADANKSFAMDPTCKRNCDDGIDQDCSAGGDPSGDVKCIVDDDCDGFRSKAMQQNGCGSPADKDQNGMLDCDDCDPGINPAASEKCGNNKDDNCNGQTDEICVGCDLDGDGFQRDDQVNGCPDPAYKQTGKPVDCDDEDAGVFPGSTDAMHPLNPKLKYVSGVLAQCGGREAGTLCAALRQLCKNKKVDGAAPQDADCDGAPAKDCPSVNCDADGDGYMDMAKEAQCDPNHQFGDDCDDTDATFFPNAPPQCGEAKPHNCLQMVGCGTDADGDGFDSDHDCDDGNKDIHPFAPEKCNGVDDDCDGLIDELNPDADGNRMKAMGGGPLLCNDSGTGLCAPVTGHCVCSQSPVNKLFFDGKRVACPAETPAVDADTTKVAPRCYGAPQPKAQSCNPQNPLDDDCDGRVDAPDGKNFPLVGMDCWPAALGVCKAALGGKVTGCDMSQANCFAIKGVNPWLTCSDTKVCPQPEKCNGFDDDCDNVVPPNETDSDGDGYIRCGSKFSGNGLGGVSYDNAQMCEAMKANGIVGCGDCAEGPGKTGGVDNSAIHPGLPKDACDGVDTDCDTSTNDGAADCAMGLTCCGAMGCHNTGNEINNCSGCGLVCTPTNATQPMCGGSTCSYTCNPGFADCVNTAPNLNGCETNIATNTANCGSCGRMCVNTNVSVLSCANGVCNSTCSPGFGNCNQPANGADDGCETSLTQTSNCGGCGRACNGANVNALNCNNMGLCNSTCVAGFANCNQPVAPAADNGCETNITQPANCGGCARACSNANVAMVNCNAMGLCNSTCNNGFGNCTMPTAGMGADDGCETNLTTTSNCGGCGRMCNNTNVAALSCNGMGLCNSTCNAGFGNCLTPPGNMADDGCETSLTQTSNCGGCGRACSNANVAVLSCNGSGLCNSTCNGTFGNCTMPTAGMGADDGCETNLATNVDNCGGCGRACSNSNVSIRTCLAGLCESTCQAGFGNCTKPTAGMGADNGCETNTNTDTSNCGACGVNCSANAWANVNSYTCAGGMCGIGACNGGFGDCDGNKLTGCEAAINQDATCGTLCTDCTQSTNNKKCVFVNAAFKCGCTNGNYMNACDTFRNDHCDGLGQCACGTGGPCGQTQQCCNNGGIACRIPTGGSGCNLDSDCCSNNCNMGSKKCQ